MSDARPPAGPPPSEIEQIRKGFIEQLEKVADGTYPPRTVDVWAARDLIRVLRASSTPPLTGEEQKRLAFLEQLMSRSGSMDNYEPIPAEVREYNKLRLRGSARGPTPGAIQITETGMRESELGMPMRAEWFGSAPAAAAPLPADAKPEHAPGNVPYPEAVAWAHGYNDAARKTHGSGSAPAAAAPDDYGKVAQHRDEWGRVQAAGAAPSEPSDVRTPFSAERTAVWKAILGTQRTELPGVPETKPVDVEDAKKALDDLVRAVWGRASAQSGPILKLTEQQANEIETEMRALESDPAIDKHAMRLFMQHPMPCGHAAGNLMTCDKPPFGCVICNG